MHRKIYILTISMFVGLVTRIFVALDPTFIIAPDEIFQSIEQAYRLLYGYGFIPWEYQYQIRSYILPATLIPILAFAKLIGNSPEAVLIATRSMIAIYSSLSILAIYHLTKEYFSTKTALLSAFLWAVWYEAIIIAPHALAETIYLVYISFAILLARIHHPVATIASLILVSAATVIRPQYILMSAATLIHLRFQYSQQVKHGFLLSTLVAIGILLCLEFVSNFNIILPSLRYLLVNTTTPIPQLFGVSPWHQYIEWMFQAISGFGFIFVIKRHSRKFAYITLPTLVLLSLNPHKEYRFVIPLLPLIVISTAIYLSKLPTRLLYPLTAVITLTSFMLLVTPNSSPVKQSENTNNRILENSLIVSKDPTLCGVYYPDTPWVLTGGYAYIQKDIPIYSQFYPPKNPSYTSHSVYQDAVIKTSDLCEPDPDYTYFRTFEGIDNLLHNISRK